MTPRSVVDSGRDPHRSIELGILGGVDLRGPDGRELRSILAQPKRLALLIYLVLAPGGFHRRDTLLGLLWPESDSQRARAALRQAGRYLRRSLGEGVLVSRGKEELGIAEGALRCDAVEFGRALQRGDAAAALGEYRGELLPGFFVPGAPEFERWLEQQRDRLRRSAAAAAWRQVESAQAAGDAATAAGWARRAAELSPGDEEAVRRLMDLLDRAGNRAAAIRAYEAFATRLRTDLELEPGPETQTLVARIRARETSREAAPPRLEPRRVLVAVLENRTGEHDLDPLGCMAADWVAQGLSEVRDLEVVSLMAAMSSSRYVAGLGAAVEDESARARALAEETGAGTVVCGAYYLSGPDLQFQVRLIDATSGSILRALPPAAAPKGAPLVAMEALRQQVTTAVAPLLSARSSHVRAAAPPPTYHAYRAYVEGLDLFISGDWQGALAHFRQATEADPEYSLPRIVSAITRWNLGQLAESAAIAREAARSRERLPPFERAVLDMVLAWLRGDWAAAHDACRRQADLAPGSLPHFQVAEEARRLNRPGEAVAVLSGLDPERGELRGFIFYWIELTTAHHLLGHHSAELEAAARARRLYPDHPVSLLLEIRALAAMGDASAVDRRLDEGLAAPVQREPRPGALLREAALELRAHGGEEAAGPLFERSLAWYRARPAAEQATWRHRRELARASYHAGRWEESERLFAELSASAAVPHADAFHHAHLQGHLDEGYLAELAVRRGDREEAGRICGWLERLDRPFLFGSNTYWRAAVAALEGNAPRAVSLLRQAFAEGLPFEIPLHTDVRLASLRGYPPFDELMRPHG